MIDRPADKIEIRKTTEYDRTDIMGGENKSPKNVVYDKWYPKTIIVVSNAGSSVKSFHPTQKPVALMEYLIKTYTNEGETVLDFTCGSGTTGVACRNLNRNFIGIDNGYCTKKKTINDISLEGLPWIEITSLRMQGVLP